MQKPDVEEQASKIATLQFGMPTATTPSHYEVNGLIHDWLAYFKKVLSAAASFVTH